MSKQPKKAPAHQFSLIPELSWWKSADGLRLFCVVEKWCKGVSKEYRPTELVVVEAGVMEKKRIPYATFVDQISAGKLIQVQGNQAVSVILRATLF